MTVRKSHRGSIPRCDVRASKKPATPGNRLCARVAYCDGKRFIVHADEMLTAFLEKQAAIYRRVEPQMKSHGSSTVC